MALCLSTWTSQSRRPWSLYDSIPCDVGTEAFSMRSMFLCGMSALGHAALDLRELRLT